MIEPTGQDIYPNLTPEQSALQNIIDIGHDYDGYNTVLNLKFLIDELVQIAKNGLDGKRIRGYAKGEFDEMLRQYNINNTKIDAEEALLNSECIKSLFDQGILKYIIDKDSI